ncbi:hypothetical protein M3Y94_00656500 [Aphelenchoides besseyi]|nr:hypothetical protein M3Y94_00656500 [Aphelenchoides besseyi]KAI6231187.1 hypothetical protein M3Y95_00355000 [Aphelenchoides besseyi]
MRLFAIIGVLSITVTVVRAGYEVEDTDDVDVRRGKRVQDPPPTAITCYCKNSDCHGLDQYCENKSCFEVFNQLDWLISRGCSNERKLDGWEHRGRMVWYFCNEDYCNDEYP